MPLAVQVLPSRRPGWSKPRKAARTDAPGEFPSNIGDPTEDVELLDATIAVRGDGDPVAAAAPTAPARALPAAIA